MDKAHTLSNVSIKTPALWTGPNFSINIHKTAPLLWTKPSLRFKHLTVDNRASKGKFISVFEIIAEAKTAGKRSHLDIEL